MADVRGKIGGTLVRLIADGDGTATGHFLPDYGSFMPLRHTLDIPPVEPIWETGDEPVESVSHVDPASLHWNGQFGFVVQWYLPDVTWSPGTEDGQPGVHLRAPDGSRASAYGTPADGGFRVSQAGPQRLWDRVEEAYTFWDQVGRPSSNRFGITATPTEQYVWYDNPNSEHRWPLPTSSVTQSAE